MGADRRRARKPALILFRPEGEVVYPKMALSKRLAGTVSVSKEGHLGHPFGSRERRERFKAARIAADVSAT
jgi:hypothetical protein